MRDRGGAGESRLSTRRAALRAVPLAAGTLAACWLAGWAVAVLPSSPGIPLDGAATAALDAVHAPGVHVACEFLAVIGEEPVSIVVAVALAGGVLLWRGIGPAVAFGLASALSAAHVILLKSVVERPGPGGLYFGLGSFPSGHAANAAVMAMFAGLLVRRPWAWAAGGAYVVVVAVSRVILRAHWLTDTIAGAAEGAGMALLVWSLWSLARTRPDARVAGR